MGLSHTRARGVIMRHKILIAAIAALSFASPTASWSADPVSGAYLAPDTKPHHARSEDTRRPHGRKTPPPVVETVVPARYCHNTACEPVTLRIWSGDSFVMDRLGRHHESITIANIEAASAASSCPAEAISADDAKRQLSSLLRNQTFFLARVAGEKDSRSAAFVTVNRRDIGKRMIDLRQARPWEGNRRPWC